MTTALVFTAHGLSVGSDLAVAFHPGAAAGPLLAGLGLGWLRERTGSVWTCAAAHNAGNASVVIGSALL